MLREVALHLFAGHATLRAAIAVSVVLIISIAITGAVASAYRSERATLAKRHFESGQLLLKEARLPDAIEEYRKALLFSPDDAGYRLSLARALMEQGRLNEAEAHLEQLQENDPGDPMANLELARIAVKRQNTKEAIDHYQRAVYEYWPPAKISERREARWELVSLLADSGHATEVVGELLQLYTTAPPDPEERARIGFLLLRFGAVSEAIRVFRELVRNHPQDAEAHRGLGRVEFALGDYVSARHELQKALRLAPGDVEAAEYLGWANAVIDLDSALPGISASERLRRDQNLLRHVLEDLSRCAGAAQAAPQMEAAQKLLASRRGGSDDLSTQLQGMAQQLWKMRAAICGDKRASDRAVDLALARAGNE